jgi:hypothetical protein
LHKVFLVLFFSSYIYSADPVVITNELINKNLYFTQNTNTGVEDVSSKGMILRTNESIEITIEHPSKEKYIIKDSFIEIYDYEFNQSQMFEINDDNSFVIDLLDNGIDTENVNYIDENSFTVTKNKSDFFVKIISDAKFIISYSDNMDYENNIVFEVIDQK